MDKPKVVVFAPGSPESLAEMEAAGCEETFLVPATADVAEVERAAELIDRR